MPAKKSNSKKQTTGTTEEWFDRSGNRVVLVGKIKRIVFENDNVCKFSIDCVNKTDKGNYAHAFITCVQFKSSCDYEIAEDELVSISGRIQTTSYNGNYSTQIVCDKIYEEQ